MAAAALSTRGVCQQQHRHRNGESCPADDGARLGDSEALAADKKDFSNHGNREELAACGREQEEKSDDGDGQSSSNIIFVKKRRANCSTRDAAELVLSSSSASEHLAMASQLLREPADFNPQAGKQCSPHIP